VVLTLRAVEWPLSNRQGFSCQLQRAGFAGHGSTTLADFHSNLYVGVRSGFTSGLPGTPPGGRPPALFIVYLYGAIPERAAAGPGDRTTGQVLGPRACWRIRVTRDGARASCI